MMTRAEHVQWVKDRALAYVQAENLSEAGESMIRDLREHAETREHPAIVLTALYMMSGDLDTAAKMQQWIDDLH